MAAQKQLSSSASGTWRLALAGLALLAVACGRAEASSAAPVSRQAVAHPAPIRGVPAVSAAAPQEPARTPAIESVGLRRQPTYVVVGGGAETEHLGSVQSLLERLPFRAALPTYAPAGLWLDVAGVSSGWDGRSANFSLYFLTADESQGLLLAQGPGQGDYTVPAADTLPAGLELDVREVPLGTEMATFVRVKIDGNPFTTNLYWSHCGIGFNIRGTEPLLSGDTVMRMAESTMHPC